MAWANMPCGERQKIEINQSCEVNSNLIIKRLSKAAYLYTARSEISGWGMIDSNGLVVVNGNEAVLIDTPTTEAQTKELLDFFSMAFAKGYVGDKRQREGSNASKWESARAKSIGDSKKSLKFVGFIATHFHDDAIGGLGLINSLSIPSYSLTLTKELAKSHSKPLPSNTFSKNLTLNLGDMKIEAIYLGGAHSRDNIVVYLPNERILFAGCMLKGAESKSLGNTEDASMGEWRGTLERLRMIDSKILIPGHDDIGDKRLIDKTLDLLKEAGY